MKEQEVSPPVVEIFDNTDQLRAERWARIMQGVHKMVLDRKIRTKMECYLALYEFHKMQKNRRISKFARVYKEKKDFELKMLAYLALLDNKIAMKAIKTVSIKSSEKTKEASKVQSIVRPFRRSRSAACTLARKRIAEISKSSINDLSKINVP